MSKKSTSSKTLSFSSIIFLAIFAIVLFVATGFSGHDATYWFSFGAMALACCIIAVVCFILNRTGKFLSDWFFNYPIVRHSVAYFIAEFIASVTSIILSIILKTEINIFAISLVVQAVILIAYLVFLVSSFQVKRISNEIRAEISESVKSIKTVRALAKTNIAYAENENVKKACVDFAEQLKFSDPVSCEQSKEYEDQLSNGVREVKQLILDKQNDEAIARIGQLSKLLNERNEIVKINK